MSGPTVLAGYTVSPPVSGVSAAPGVVSGGLVVAGAYQYNVTFATAFGETTPSPVVTNIVAGGSGSVVLSSIPISSSGNVSSRRLYRTTAGGGSLLLVGAIDDNYTTTFTDTAPDANLGAAVPTANTARSRQIIPGYIQFGFPAIVSVDPAITATPGGGQATAYQLTAGTNFVTVAATAGDSVKLPLLNANLVGTVVTVVNDGANSINVFPATGQNASAGTNIAVAVAAAARAEFTARTSSVWVKTR